MLPALHCIHSTAATAAAASLLAASSLRPCLFSSLFPQRTLKSEHLLFQLYHLHVDREAVKKALRKKKQEEETVRVWG